MTVSWIPSRVRRAIKLLAPDRSLTITVLVVAMCLSQIGSAGMLVSAFPGAGRADTASAQTTNPLPKAGQIIVVMKPGAVTSAATTANRGRVVPAHVYRSVVNGFATTATDAQIRAFANDPNVAYVMQDYPVYAAAQTTPTNISRIGANTNPTAGIDGINNPVNADIAIVDSGVNRHPDLNVAGGYNCTSSNTGDWGDKVGHGTHVAGTAAAIDNGSGVVGAAPGARIWSVRALGPTGGNVSDIVCATGLGCQEFDRDRRRQHEPDRNQPDGFNLHARRRTENGSLQCRGPRDSGGRRCRQ